MKDLAHQFLDFARSKPADEEYVYECSGHCAFAQFLRENGFAKEPFVDPWFWQDGNGPEHRLPPGVNDCLNPVSRDTNRFTFGALTTRLESILSGGK